MRGKKQWLSPPDTSKGSPSPLPEDLRVIFKSKNLIPCILFQAAKLSAASTLTPGAPIAVCSAYTCPLSTEVRKIKGNLSFKQLF